MTPSSPPASPPEASPRRRVFGLPLPFSAILRASAALRQSRLFSPSPARGAPSTTRAGAAHPALHTPDPTLLHDPQRHADPEAARHIQRLHALAAQRQMAAYRAERLAYAAALTRRRPAEALELYLDAWYLGLNGARNCALPDPQRPHAPGAPGARLAHEDPPFDAAHPTIDPLLLKRIRRLRAALGLGLPQMEALLLEVAGATWRAYAPPLAPRQAWQALGPALL